MDAQLIVGTDMDQISLDYLVDKYFYSTLRKGDRWDLPVSLGPGIVLLFVELPDKSAEFLIDALLAEDDVALAASNWLNDTGPASQIGSPFVRYAAFPDLRKRMEVMAFIRLHLPGDRYT